MTLPGIAALILGVGMAVDANIITYERIKDELKTGRSVISAYRAGNRRSLATIFDANITTILAALVLFFYGQSSVKRICHNVNDRDCAKLCNCCLWYSFT